MSEIDIDRECLDLTAELIRRPSVTPDDAGCQQLLGERLSALGCSVHHLRFGETDNLLAWHGESGPLTVLVGHTDVVPPGPLERWTSPPFEPTLRDGKLWGRGAADMKSGVAAMQLALERFLRAKPDHSGRVGILLTSDEEGSARDGIVKVMPWLSERGDRIDCALIGEPSSDQRLGDRIRVGRRGSAHAEVLVHGIQGHTAYPEKARNPVHQAAPALAELATVRFDEGNEFFPPSTFQIYEIQAGVGGSNNVIPGSMLFRANWRFATCSTAESLEARLREVLDRHGLEYTLKMRVGSRPFLTTAMRLRGVVAEAIRVELGVKTVQDTGGGTSDGRYISPTGAEVVEFGPVNASIHKIDEHVAVADLGPMVRVYGRALAALHG